MPNRMAIFVFFCYIFLIKMYGVFSLFFRLYTRNICNAMRLLRNMALHLPYLLQNTQYCRNIDFTLKVLAIKKKIFLSNICKIFAKCKHPFVVAIIHDNIANFGQDIANTKVLTQYRFATGKIRKLTLKYT